MNLSNELHAGASLPERWTHLLRRLQLNASHFQYCYRRKGSRSLVAACGLALAICAIPAAAQNGLNSPSNGRDGGMDAGSQPMTAGESRPTPLKVSYTAGQLTITAMDSTLEDILQAVRVSTGASVDAPEGASRERMAIRVGPGPARAVLSELLSQTSFNYLILASDHDPLNVQSVMLMQRSSGASPVSPLSARGRDKAPVDVQPHDVLEITPTSPVENVASVPAEIAPTTSLTENVANVAKDLERHGFSVLTPPDPNNAGPTPTTTQGMTQELQRMYQERLRLQQARPGN